VRQNYAIFFVILVVLSTIVILQLDKEENHFEIMLDKSGPYVGVKYPSELGFDGAGIKIALIDTGIDYNHPDLLGYGPEGKVVGGYDFVDNDQTPLDTNGHGTEVAGIIAADGQLIGIAPKSKILAYRVSNDGESVSSDLIIMAIKQAIEDKADIINISLGVNRTNQRIDDAVNEAVSQGIVVVTAAGNNGPGLGTIGSPGLNHNSITVGATYNNISSSLVSTLEINEKSYQIIPMIGTEPLEESIIEKIQFGKFGRERDLLDLDVKNSILLVERGSDLEDEIVYFSIKESNAAKQGAKALLVYNNEPGNFLGELIHEFSGPDYKPSIPTLSISREEGLQIRELLLNNTIGNLNVFFHPDFVAHFSSRGPVSPFYIKPDLVAPGAFVNSTMTDGKYNLTSGTSFAAPHVSGAAALLLQKNPKLQTDQIKSLLITTADPVSDPLGVELPFEIAGAGRLNITKAFDASLIFQPTFLSFNLSPEKPTQTKHLQIRNLENEDFEFELKFSGNEDIDFDYSNEGKKATITATLFQEFFGESQGRITITHNDLDYTIPVTVHVTQTSLTITEEQGKLKFNISQPEKWSYAKISVTNKQTGNTDSTSLTPNGDTSLTVYEPGEYWIEANVISEESDFDLYDIILVPSIENKDNFRLSEYLDIPGRIVIILIGVVVVIGLVGLKIKKG